MNTILALYIWLCANPIITVCLVVGVLIVILLFCLYPEVMFTILFEILELL